MTRQLITLTVAMLGYAATVVAQGTSSATPPRDQDKPAPFRVAVDVVAVDVQAIDRTGRPVPDLGPEKFSVTINGRRRRVVSAERIGSDVAGGPERSITASGASSPALGRVIVLAVDCISFDATASRGVIQAVRDFVKQLSPDDFLGLSAYPNGAKLNPTRDHAAVLRALDTVVGQRDLAEISRFHVRPSEIVDLTREMMGASGPAFEAVATRECGEAGADPFCRQRLMTDVTGMALYLEGQATASLGMLRSIVEEMNAFLGRKTLLLISGGMVASDSPGGRPDLGEIGVRVGKEAAFANTTIYTLFIESRAIDRFSAQQRTGDRNAVNASRDSALLGRWLEQFTGAAGGALFSVQVGNAEPALARIRTELSSYYLLGVEPGDEDRDGRTHEISVKTTQPNVTIRGRRWVRVPKRTGGTATASPATTKVVEPVTAAPPAPRRRRRRGAAARRPGRGEALADVFDRGNTDAMQRRSHSRAIFRICSADFGSPTARGRTIADGPRSSRSSWLSPACAATPTSHATKAAGCSPSITSRVRATERRRRVRMRVVRHRSVVARRASSAGKRDALHSPRAAALPHEPAASPGTRVRIGAAMAAWRTDARAGARDREPLRRGR